MGARFAHGFLHCRVRKPRNTPAPTPLPRLSSLSSARTPPTPDMSPVWVAEPGFSRGEWVTHTASRISLTWLG